MSISIKLHGGLGNRLFQLAGAYSIAKDMNKSFHISNNYRINNVHSSINYFNNIFKNIPVNDISDYHIFDEPIDGGLHYIDIKDKLQSYNNILLTGFYQSEKYFKHYKDELCSLFKIDATIKTYLCNKYHNLENKFFIHIRRGDYLKTTMHNVNLDIYYKNCFNLLPLDAQFLVFSDDIDYCKSLEIFIGKNVQFVEKNENELNSLYLMSMCRLGGIAANSSFSWWGSYLNDNMNKLVFFPDKWFNNDWTVEIGYENSKVVSTTSLDKNLKIIPTISLNETPKIKLLDLSDTTFMIAFRIDSEDRFINLSIQLKYLLSNFNTNFIIIEDGPEQHFMKLIENGILTNDMMKSIDYTYIHNDDVFFHRMKNLNKCLNKVKTLVCVNLDIDVLIPINYYIEAQNKILNNMFDIIHPFNNPPGCYYINQNDKDKIIMSDISQIKSYCKNSKAGNGFLIFFRTSEYIRMGGENEEFKAYGPEDNERICRAIYHGLKYGRLNNEVYHMEHSRGPNSSYENPYFAHNWEIYNKMKEIYTNKENNIHYDKVVEWLNN